MELKEAFGSAFVFSDSLKLEPDVTPEVTPEVTDMVADKPKRKSKHALPPGVYVLRVQIGHDDCHLLCMFLLIFAISFILSSR